MFVEVYEVETGDFSKGTFSEGVDDLKGLVHFSLSC